MAVLGLRFCARAFSSCGKWGPLFIAVRGPLCITVRGPLTIVASLVAEHRLQTRRLSNLWLTGLVTPQHVGSSQTRTWTRVPCIGRQILNHCATREAPRFCFLKNFLQILCLLLPFIMTRAYDQGIPILLRYLRFRKSYIFLPRKTAKL